MSNSHIEARTSDKDEQSTSLRLHCKGCGLSVLTDTRIGVQRFVKSHEECKYLDIKRPTRRQHYSGKKST